MSIAYEPIQHIFGNFLGIAGPEDSAPSFLRAFKAKSGKTRSRIQRLSKITGNETGRA
jgi:hypothetical protein